MNYIKLDKKTILRRVGRDGGDAINHIYVTGNYNVRGDVNGRLHHACWPGCPCGIQVSSFDRAAWLVGDQSPKSKTSIIQSVTTIIIHKNQHTAAVSVELQFDDQLCESEYGREVKANTWIPSTRCHEIKLSCKGVTAVHCNFYLEPALRSELQVPQATRGANRGHHCDLSSNSPPQGDADHLDLGKWMASLVLHAHSSILMASHRWTNYFESQPAVVGTITTLQKFRL